MQRTHNPNKDMEINSPPTDGISCLKWSPNSNLLAAGSWDNQVRCWEIAPNGQSQPKAAISHDMPVLCTAWSNDGSRIFSGGCDKQVKMWNLGAGNQTQVVAQHDQPIKEVFYISQANMLLTGSWDGTLKYWDMRTPNAQLTIQLPGKVYSMDVSHPLLVVATSDRHVITYDLNNPQKEFKRIQSPLKRQSRTVACFPQSLPNGRTSLGFALGSIEGRVGIQYCEQKDVAKNFAFKCHRDPQGKDVNIYAINCIKFHPRYGTFLTAGADGALNFWDKDRKERLKKFAPANAPISAADFNQDGSILAYAVSYDWSQGHQAYGSKYPQQNHILLHGVADNEIKPKGASGFK